MWKDVKPSDFEAFINCGFLSRQGILNEALILDAIDHNFQDDEATNSVQITFNGGDFRGAILNIASTLTDVQQSISSTPQLEDAAKAELTQLINELKEELAKAPEQEAESLEEAELLAHHAQVAIEQLNAERPNKKLISISVEGLEKAAKNLERVAVPVVTIAAKIAVILRPFMA